MSGIYCDVPDCTVPALVAVRVVGSPGHVHVCKVHGVVLERAETISAAQRLVAGAPCRFCPTPDPENPKDPR